MLRLLWEFLEGGMEGLTANKASSAFWKGNSKGTLGSGSPDQMVWGRFGCLFQCSTRNLGACGTALAAGSFPAHAVSCPAGPHGSDLHQLIATGHQLCNCSVPCCPGQRDIMASHMYSRLHHCFFVDGS